MKSILNYFVRERVIRNFLEFCTKFRKYSLTYKAVNEYLIHIFVGVEKFNLNINIQFEKHF